MPIRYKKYIPRQCHINYKSQLSRFSMRVKVGASLIPRYYLKMMQMKMMYSGRTSITPYSIHTYMINMMYKIKCKEIITRE